tara:strand:+ start:1612 stop:1842 length:231 start_codon:yes stop_codon:yes gene_type:complete
MSNVISLQAKLTLEQQVERDMRMYNYNPNDPDEVNEYWEDLWCENDLGEEEELSLECSLGGKRFNIKLSMCKEKVE